MSIDVKGDQNMKKALVMILVAMLAVSVAGCSSSTSGTTSSSASSSVSSAATTEAPTTAKADSASDNGTLGKYTVAIESARLSKDYKGNPVVVVKYKFTNNGDEATAFMTAVSGKAFQDGVELPIAVVDSTSDKKYNSEDSLKQIKKGASIEVEQGYSLSNKTSKIEVEASELVSFSGEKLTKDFDATKLAQ